LALLLCNMCRVCMSVAIIPMAAEFGWSGSTQVLPHCPRNSDCHGALPAPHAGG
jgi:hypothetical protein